MAIDAAAEYLARLLNRPINAAATLRLSSAQRARFNAWLHGQGLSADEKALAGEFTLEALLIGLVPVAAASPKASAPADSNPETRLLGVDIQSISELMTGKQLSDLKADAELLRIFTLREISYAQAKPVPAETLAGIFAAKEAVRKCMGEPILASEDFRALEVLPDATGRPRLAGYEISISHSGDYALAVACRGTAALPIPIVNQQIPKPSTNVQTGLGRHWRTAFLAAAVVLIVQQFFLLAWLVR